MLSGLAAWPGTKPKQLIRNPHITMQNTEKAPQSNPGRYISVVILIAILLAIGYVCINRFMPSSHLASMFALTDTKTQAAHDALAGQIASESGGKIVLADFSKTDGQAGETFGVQTYSLTFTGVVAVGANGFWLMHNMGSPFSFAFSDTAGAFGGMNGATQVHAGNRVRIAGRMDGQKSEQGWHFDLTSCQVAQ